MSKTRTSLLLVADFVLIAAGLSLVVCVGPKVSGDAIERYAALRDLMEHGAPNATKSSLVGPLLASPLWWLGGKLDDREKTIAYFNLIVFVLAALALFAMLRRALGAATTGRFLVVMTFGSGFLHELSNFNNEVFSSLAIGCGMLALTRLSRASKLWPSLAIVLGTVNMAANTIGVALALARVALRDRRWRYLLIVISCAAGILLEAWIRRGSPFITGYEGNHGHRTALPFSGLPGFSYPFLLGVISILFSFGKGLLFFYPGLFVPAPQLADNEELRLVHQAWLLVVVGLIAVYARWWAWYGGLCWGPRFFLFASLPAALALASWAEQARSTLSAFGAVAVLALACWVGFDGLVFEIQNLDICATHDNKLEAFCWYLPEFSPLVRPFITSRELVAWERWAVWIFGAAYLRVSGSAWRKLFVFGRAAIGIHARRAGAVIRELRF